MITVIANLKGGSGKSTVAFNLGIWLLYQRQQVVAYDLDPQQTLKDVSRVRKSDDTEPVLNVFNVEDNEGVAGELCRHKGHVLVDVGASNMQAMRLSMDVAHRIVIPVPPGQPDVWATQRFLSRLNHDEDTQQPELIAFINRADTHRAVRESDEAYEALQQMNKLRVLEPRLCQRTSYRRTLSEGLSVFELDRKSKGAKEFERFARALYPELNS